MSADEFLDTNVLVYSVDLESPEKRQRAIELINRGLVEGAACISFQVVQETLNVLAGRTETPAERIRQFMDCVLVPLWQVYPSPSLYQDAIAIQGRYGLSFHDSLIVAAALEAGCSRLYSEDLQHDQQIQSLMIVNPFLDQ